MPLGFSAGSFYWLPTVVVEFAADHTSKERVIVMRRVFIVGEPAVVESVLLSDGSTFTNVGSALPGPELVEKLNEANVECAVFVGQPDAELLQVLTTIAHTPLWMGALLVYSTAEEFEFSERCLAAGADGYLMRGSAGDSLAKVIKRVIEGEHYLSVRMTRHLMPSTAADEAEIDVDLYDLTEKEAEVFKWLGKRLDPAAIGKKVGLSEHAVRKHLRVLMGKVGAEDLWGLRCHVCAFADCVDPVPTPDGAEVDGDGIGGCMERNRGLFGQ